MCGWNHYSGTWYFTIPYDKSIQSKYTYVEIECFDEGSLHIIKELNYYTSLSPPKQSTLDAKGVDFPVKNSAKLVDGDPNNLDATMALADYTSSVSTNHDNNCSSYPHIYVDFDNNNSFKLNLSNNKYEQIGIDSENGLSISVWIKPASSKGYSGSGYPSSSDSTATRIIDFGDGSSNNNIIIEWTKSSKLFRFIYYDSSGNKQSADYTPKPAEINDFAWTHLAVTISKKTSKQNG